MPLEGELPMVMVGMRWANLALLLPHLRPSFSRPDVMKILVMGGTRFVGKQKKTRN